MDWKARAGDLLGDARRYLGQAMIEWGASIKDDPVPHVFSLGAGVILMLSIAWLV